MSGEEEENKKGLVIYGRDVSQIPCFRSSMLNGMGTGAVAGLAYFMFTSKPRTATHVAFGSFFCSTISCWFYCRYKWSKEKFNVGQLQSIMKKPPLTTVPHSDDEKTEQ